MTLRERLEYQQAWRTTTTLGPEDAGRVLALLAAAGKLTEGFCYWCKCFSGQHDKDCCVANAIAAFDKE